MELTALAFAALAVTKITDWVRNGIDPGDTAPKWVWNTVAFAIGVALAFLFDLLPPYEVTNEAAAHVFVGLILGAAGSGFHEVLDYISGAADAKRGKV